jgi:hypothetical protein
MARSTRYVRFLPVVSAAILAGAALAPRIAHAQANLPSPTAMGPVVKGNNDISPAQPSQPGLPGASRPTSVSRGTISGDMMSPNAALFDAIDRGDLAAARDAVGRGADLGATNAVGQSPIDESVSLGRNDITFLLVTLLHAEGAQITDAQGPMNAPPPTTLGLSTRDEHVAAEPVGFFSPPPSNSTVTQNRKGRRYPPLPVAAKSMVAPSAPPPSPPVYGDSSGAPVPASGFLGFGNSGTGQQ